MIYGGFVEKCDRGEKRGWGAWATELNATGEFIGFVGLNVVTVTRHARANEIPF